jgi:hypothetical protein
MMRINMTHPFIGLLGCFAEEYEPTLDRDVIHFIDPLSDNRLLPNLDLDAEFYHTIEGIPMKNWDNMVFTAVEFALNLCHLHFRRMQVDDRMRDLLEQYCIGDNLFPVQEMKEILKKFKQCKLDGTQSFGNKTRNFLDIQNLRPKTLNDLPLVGGPRQPLRNWQRYDEAACPFCGAPGPKEPNGLCAFCQSREDRARGVERRQSAVEDAFPDENKCRKCKKLMGAGGIPDQLCGKCMSDKKRKRDEEDGDGAGGNDDGAGAGGAGGVGA